MTIVYIITIVLDLNHKCASLEEKLAEKEKALGSKNDDGGSNLNEDEMLRLQQEMEREKTKHDEAMAKMVKEMEEQVSKAHSEKVFNFTMYTKALNIDSCCPLF